MAHALRLARGSARALIAGRVSDVAPDRVSAELANHLLPHLDSDARIASGSPPAWRGPDGASDGGAAA